MMRAKEEARHAWKLWNLLTDVADRLWAFYENDFFEFCAQDDPEDGLKRDDDP
jgi:hypothetical protein